MHLLLLVHVLQDTAFAIESDLQLVLHRSGATSLAIRRHLRWIRASNTCLYCLTSLTAPPPKKDLIHLPFRLLIVFEQGRVFDFAEAFEYTVQIVSCKSDTALTSGI